MAVSIRIQQQVAMLLVMVLTVPHLAKAMRLYKSRMEAFNSLGGKETRLYFSECEQQTNTATFIYAIDSSLSRDHSQCAQSVLLNEPYWLGILELPAYITTVTVLNVDQTFLPFPDGLLRLQVLVNDEDCFTMEAKLSFDKRTFPCDSIGDVITIKSLASEPVVLSICEVEVVRIPLKFITMSAADQILPTAQCLMSTPTSGKCLDIQDNSTATCAVASASSGSESPYFVITLQVPSIINEVLVQTSSMDSVKVLVHGQECTRRSNTPKFHCKFFGESVVVALRGAAGTGQLSICEVNVLGHESDLREPIMYTYLGCFIEQSMDRDLPQLAAATKLTADKCYQVCKRHGFKYFGLHAQRFCYCGFTYGKHGQAMDNFGCEKPCEGDGKNVCGNDRANSIFEILS